jgi:hypothetical protein
MAIRASRVYTPEEETELRQIAKTPRDTWRTQIEDFCTRNKRKGDKDYSRVYAKVTGILAKSKSSDEVESNGAVNGRGTRGGRRHHVSPLAIAKELSVSPNEIRFTVRALRIESNGGNLEFVVEI